VLLSKAEATRARNREKKEGQDKGRIGIPTAADDVLMNTEYEIMSAGPGPATKSNSRSLTICIWYNEEDGLC